MKHNPPCLVMSWLWRKVGSISDISRTSTSAPFCPTRLRNEEGKQQVWMCSCPSAHCQSAHVDVEERDDSSFTGTQVRVTHQTQFGYFKIDKSLFISSTLQGAVCSISASNLNHNAVLYNLYEYLLSGFTSAFHD